VYVEIACYLLLLYCCFTAALLLLFCSNLRPDKLASKIVHVDLTRGAVRDLLQGKASVLQN
jgi:hypothetical protein